MVTPEQILAICESFAGIADLSGPISSLFYGRLFELAPEVRPLFRQDIAVQGRKLMDMLAALIAGLDHFETMKPMLRAMGQRHAGYGVKPEHYAQVESALLWALSIALQSDFTPAQKAAWRTLIADISAVMKDGASELSES